MQTLWKGPLIRLIVRVDADAIPHDALNELASLLEQQCVSAYCPERDEGFMAGPKAAAWKPFDLVEFDRYDDALNLKPMGPISIKKKLYVPDPDPAVVARQMAAAGDRICQVFTLDVLSSFAPRQVKLTDNAIHRVVEHDGPDALTIPRLEGIYELVTEHLWCGTLTAAAKSFQGESS